MKILLALDQSTSTMDEAVKLAIDRQASLTALFVLDATWNDYIGHDWLSGSGSRADFLDYAKDDELSQKLAIVEDFRKRCPFSCEVKTATGRVTDEILREMSQGGYDLLVMSHPLRRGLELVRNAAGAIMKEAQGSVYFVYQL
jgi:nucleotide-binding universal stress UspA family protein